MWPLAMFVIVAVLVSDRFAFASDGTVPSLVALMVPWPMTFPASANVTVFSRSKKWQL